MSGGFASAQESEYNPFGVSKAYMLKRVNNIRMRGCRCGHQKMAAVKPLVWNENLSYTAFKHAEDMSENDYFGHKSKNGDDIGDRLEKAGYKWQYAGENLAIGQKSFDEALQDWMESPTHCQMLMHPNMKEMGLGRVNEYWVHHFGALMPPKTRRIKTIYREGE